MELDLLPLFERAQESTGKVIAGTKDVQYGSSTPCTEFDVKKLLNHIIGGQYLFAEVCNDRPVDVSQPVPDLIGADASSSYAQAAKTALEAWRMPGVMEKTLTFPFGKLPAQAGLGVAFFETLVHGWDLAKGTGQKAELDPELATAGLQIAKMGVTDEVRKGPNAPFGAEVKVPDSASPTDKLVAFLGRKP